VLHHVIIFISFFYEVSRQEELNIVSEKPKIDPARAKEMQERNRERGLIVREIKSQGPLTIDELSKATGLEKSRLLRHVIAMRQFGKLQVVGERNEQLTYDVPK
jgi:predicted transcriptional regulator